MKLICSLFLLLNAHARDVILIENAASKEDGAVLKAVLEKKFHFPSKLITMRQKACDSSSEAIVHLCLGLDAELVIVKINRYILKNSFGEIMNGEELN